MNPIIKIGIPVVTSPMIKTVIISDGLSDQPVLIDFSKPLKIIKQTKKKPTDIGKKDQEISDVPNTQIAYGDPRHTTKT